MSLKYAIGQPVYPWIEKAMEEMGISETQKDFEDKLFQYSHAAEFEIKSKDDPWCAMFVCWCLADKGTRSAWARSFINYGIKLTVPVYGCIVVLKRGKNSGHVGFFMGKENGRLLLLGGNQNNAVCVKDYDASDVLGYRWPPFHAHPATAR